MKYLKSSKFLIGLLALSIALGPYARVVAQTPKGAVDPGRRAVFRQNLEEARGGSVKAMTEVGWSYFDGDGTIKSNSEALRWWNQASAMGDLDARNGLGVYLVREPGAGNAEKGVDIFKELAEKKYAPAMRNLGACYEEGRGIEKNLTQALTWYTKAADAGNAPAMLRVGWYYHEGISVKKDAARAFGYFEKAAKAGLIEAADTVGQCHEFGDGTKIDLNKARVCYEKSVEAKYPPAYRNLGRLYLYGSGVTADSTRAFKLFREAMNLNYGQVGYELGYCLERGLGTQQDVISAQMAYLTGQQSGDARCELALARIKPACDLIYDARYRKLKEESEREAKIAMERQLASARAAQAKEDREREEPRMMGKFIMGVVGEALRAGAASSAAADNLDHAGDNSEKCMACGGTGSTPQQRKNYVSGEMETLWLDCAACRGTGRVSN